MDMMDMMDTMDTMDCSTERRWSRRLPQLLSAFCRLPCFKAGAPSICPVRRSRVKLQASDAVETRIMLASANQRFEGARICRGSSIAA